MNERNRARWKLIAIFMLFLGPLLAAYVLYYGMHGMRAGAATNKGELLTPAKPLPEVVLAGSDGSLSSFDVLHGQWTYLQVAPKGCGDECQQSLKETRQIWALLHDERERVQRVLLVGGEPAALPEQPRLKVYGGDLAALWAVIEAHGATDPGTIYLIDPHGNWVLYYLPAGKGEGLFRDTKHLLGLSHIG